MSSQEPTRPGNEFKFFRQIEDAISGTLAFLLRFCRTTLTLAFRLGRVSDVVDSNAEPFNYSRPFTYLGLCTILLVAVGRVTYQSLYFQIDSLFALISAVTELPSTPTGVATTTTNVVKPSFFRDALSEFPEMDLMSVLTTTFPVVLAVVALAAIASMFACWNCREQRPELVRTVCYAAGFGLLGFIIVIPSAIDLPDIVAASLDLDTDSAGFGFAWLALALPAAAYLLLWPGVLLYSWSKRNLASLRSAGRVKKTIAFLASALLMVVIMAGAVVAAVAPYDIKTTTNPPDLGTSLASVELLADALVTRVVLKGNSDRTHLILQSPVRIKVSRPSGAGYEELASLNGTVEAWTDPIDNPVLTVSNGETKWIIVTGRLDDTLANRLREASGLHSIALLFKRIDGDTFWAQGFWRPVTPEDRN